MVRLPAQYHRRAGGWPPGWVVPAGTHVDRRVLPRSIPHLAFRQPAEVPIGPYGFATGIVAAGTVTVSVGPSGADTWWELTQADIFTSTGSSDISTCLLFIQPAGTPHPFWQVASSTLGGSDAIGLAGIKIVPGERLFAKWSAANNGDTATLILAGVMRVLT